MCILHWTKNWLDVLLVNEGVAKNDQSLCNIVMVVLSLKIGLMEYILSCPKGIA